MRELPGGDVVAGAALVKLVAVPGSKARGGDGVSIAERAARALAPFLAW
jgi:hypothetical protein